MLPSWDLLITAIFVTIVGYGFIVGKDTTLKILIGTYIAILATDGMSFLMYRLFFGPSPAVSFLNLNTPTTTQVTVKLFLFVVCIVLLTARGSFSASFPGETKGPLGVLVQAALGFMLAALITSTLLVFLAGSCFLPGVGCQPSNLAEFITQGSTFANHLLTYSYVWFTLPAVALGAISAAGE